MKRILYTVLNGNIAGGQKVCLNIMLAAEQANYQVFLLSQTDGPFVRITKAHGIKTYIVSLRRSFYFHKLPILITILQRERIDLVHTHDAAPGNILMRLACFLTHTPVISHLHIKNHFSRNLFSRAFAQTLDNLTAKRCKKIIAVCQATKKELILQGYPESKIEVVYNVPCRNNVCAPQSRAVSLKEFNIPENALIFLHIGRLCPDKGQAELIMAMADILKSQDNVYCLIVGKDQRRQGNYRQSLEQLLRTDILKDRIRLLGFRQDVEGLINLACAVVLPSFAEGLPLVILEAMQNKKPVIAYNCDGIAEQIEDAVNGYLVPPGDITGLKTAMLKIIEQPEQAKRMGLNGYNLLNRKFNREKHFNQLLSIYSRIENERAKR